MLRAAAPYRCCGKTKPISNSKEFAMWYVVQVVGGRENTVLHKIEEITNPKTYKKAFVPKYETKKRYSGVWKTKEEVLFPGYVFVDTRTPDLFRAELNKISAMTKLLSGETGSGDKRFVSLTNEEKTLICAFTEDDRFVMKMSEGVIEGDEIRILNGPLMGHTGLVKKIDRHKRLAYLELSMFGRNLSIKVGLEIIHKS